MGKAEVGARRSEPVSAACRLGEATAGSGSDIAVSSMSSPEKEKLNPDIFALEFVVDEVVETRGALKFMWQNFKGGVIWLSRLR